jgi:hypothetical protein
MIDRRTRKLFKAVTGNYKRIVAADIDWLQRKADLLGSMPEASAKTKQTRLRAFLKTGY